MTARRPLCAAIPALLLLLPVAAAQDKPAKPPTPPAAPTAPAAKGPDETSLVHEFDKVYLSKDPTARAAAVSKLGAATRQLPDAGRSRYVAKAIGKALDDDDLEVQSAAVTELAFGRDVDTTLELLGKDVENIRKEIDKRSTRVDQASKTYVNRATRLFGDTCRALANYRDDRAVDSLASIIQRLRPNGDGYDVSTRLIGRIAEPLLSLGTQSAVDACVKQTQTYSNTDGFQEPAAKELHRVLSEFATKVGKAPPDFSPTWYVAWAQWFRKNGDALPKALGKIKDPPDKPPADMGKGDNGGAASR
jgi:hypothetical protein